MPQCKFPAPSTRQRRDLNFPGSLRELEPLIERAALEAAVGSSPVNTSKRLSKAKNPAPGQFAIQEAIRLPLREGVAGWERHLVEQALD